MLRLVLCLLLCGLSLLSDTLFKVRGRVFDPSKRPVPNASLLIIEDGSAKQVATSETNDAGTFLISLPRGRYLFKVRHAGFAEQTASVQVAAADQQISVSLSIEREAVSITVSDQASKLDMASDSHQDSLKLSSRDLGVLPIKDGDVLSALSFFTNPAGGQSPTIIIDGMERTNGATLTVSQVQEVRVNNNAYSAEYPKPGKDRIEVDTKPGSDTFHGSFALRARNAIFDARNPFAASKPAFSRNGYEASLSGPMVAKKLFFFLSADRENQQQVQPIYAYLPSGLVNQQVLAPFTRDLLLGRLDWQQSETHRLSAKYEFHQDVASNLGVGGFVLQDAGIESFHRDYRIEVQDQYVLSPTALNNFRLALGTNYEHLSSQQTSASIVVPGAFQQGGAQVDHSMKEPRYEFQDTLSVVRGSVTVKGGLDVKLHPFSSYNADNFGGTYQFSSLSAYQANQPLLYSFNQGSPLIVSQQNDYAWFLQAERRWSRVMIFGGVRHEFQSHVSKYGNLAPRVATALSLDARGLTALRLGGGFFYDRRPPTILQQVNRFNGVNTLQYIVTNPSFPFVGGLSNIPATASTIYQLDESLTFPRIYQASATLERKLPAGLLVTVDYTYQRGEHLFRTRNINAPLPVTLIRPFTGVGNIDQIESSASSRGNILNVTVKSPPNRHYQVFAQYTLSYLRDDTNSAFGPPTPGLPAPGAAQPSLFSLPADNYDLKPEWGPSNNDIRHRFGVTATVELPWRLTLGTLTSVQSALPYNITTGFDNNGDTDQNDRPFGVTRNTGRQAGLFSIDLYLARPVTVEARGRHIEGEIAVDAFNALNRTNPSSYVGVETSPLFGQPNAAYNGRELQFSLRVHF